MIAIGKIFKLIPLAENANEYGEIHEGILIKNINMVIGAADGDKMITDVLQMFLSKWDKRGTPLFKTPQELKIFKTEVFGLINYIKTLEGIE